MSASTPPSFPAEGLTGFRRLFVGGGYAYVTSIPGYDVYDVRNPAAIARVGTAQTGGPTSFKQIVLNGSGLGVAAVGVNPVEQSPPDQTHDVWLYDTRTPQETAAFQTLVRTPGITRAVSIYNGLCYVANGNAGLQVVNYLAYDSRGINPTITLVTSLALTTPTNGAAEEGKFFRASASVTDDVQVRNVEFYIDGIKVATDGNFPFEQSLATPRRTPQKTSFTLRAKATDTGGNFAWSETIAVEMAADMTPPLVVGTLPARGQIVGAVGTVTAFFDAPISPETINDSTFQVISAGMDNLFGTSDDVVASGGEFSYREAFNTAVITFRTNLPAGLLRAVLRSPLADTAGNPMSRPFEWEFWALGTEDTDQDGIPDALEIAQGLDPQNPDSDGDGILDGDEDFDNDGLPTRWELRFEFNSRLRDTDGNAVDDGQEDSDFDTFNNLAELTRGLNPLNWDSDGDGWDDATEIREGTDPLDRSSGPLIRASSAVVGYFNGAPEEPPANTVWSMFSPVVAYRNHGTNAFLPLQRPRSSDTGR